MICRRSSRDLSVTSLPVLLKMAPEKLDNYSIGKKIVVEAIPKLTSCSIVRT